ncbi:hypothetical protein [Bdellovibrio sp. HCB209]|uniref:hypothetical protein n=1 Tax=Bdellovibrio sp. HCB209 TaxID=3394354 RepID=UPI0039B53E6A
MTTPQKSDNTVKLSKKGQPPLQENLDSLKKDAARIAEEKQANDKTDNEAVDEFEQHPLSPLDNSKGKIGVPILLWFLGVPGFVVILLWFFFFRG